jgi:alanine racemase
MESFAQTIVRIDREALKRNIGQVKKCVQSSGIIAVVKDNAYGHGIGLVSEVLESYVSGFAVATLDEASELRALVPRKPIWVFAGFKDKAELSHVVEMKLTSVVHSDHQVNLLRSVKNRPQIVLEMDTGMGRLGFQPGEFEKALTQVLACCEVSGVMSHFSSAEEIDSQTTRVQLERLLKKMPEVGLPRSIANSAGILVYPESCLELVRPGLMLYGVSPFPETCGPDHDLVPALTFESYLISVRLMSRGQKIGYGGSWTCPEDMRVGVVGCGYGDGYPRSAPSGTSVLLQKAHIPIIGRISMDSMMVDLRSVPDAVVGDRVTLWGPDLPIEIVAKNAGTIPNQLLVNLMPRARRAVE